MSLPPSIAEAPEPIPLPDVRRLELTPYWPAWVASRFASMKAETQRDPKTGKWREMTTLPANKTLKAAERDELARYASELRALWVHTPANDQDAEKLTLTLVTELMLVLPSATQNELSAEARGAAYMAALDDIPPWAVAGAVRRWHRGDGGKNPRGEPYDYHWCPAPAELRRVALGELHVVQTRANLIERLLGAEPLIEHSEEHCRAMRVRLADLFRSLGTPLVGKDGSGGAAGEKPADGAHCGTQPKHSPA